VRRNLSLFFLLAGLAVQGKAQKLIPWSHGENDPVAAKVSVLRADGVGGIPGFRGNADGTLLPPFVSGIHAPRPDPAILPKGPLGDSIRLGLQIFRDTPRYASAYVGDRLSCSNCHLRDGIAAYSSPLVGVPGLFPMYNKRAGRVITFEDRVQECFTRSENGRPLPSRSPELVAIVAYIQWLSRGQRAGHALPGRGLVKLPPLHGDPARGARIYAQQCAVCHQADGAGIPPLMPPLWGPNSFNDGAGMSHVAQMAAFVQHNMPQNHPGTLTPQQAFDVAAYVDGKPRPKFNPRYAAY
jgi:thiosulfate dehydrogenase